MQVLRDKHWTEVRDSYGRVRGRIEAAEGDGKPIGRSTVPTNLDPCELPETEPLSKEFTQVGLWPQVHVEQRAALSGLSGKGCA